MQKVAEMTGLCRQTISDAENGRGKIGLETYLVIADAVGVDLSSNVLPKTLERSCSDVNIMDKCRGITPRGNEFEIFQKKKRQSIAFHYDGADYSIPFDQFILNDTTQSKPLYIFAAQSEVENAIDNIRFKKDWQKFRK